MITAVGSNITYGVWQARAGNDPEHESFALHGVKFLDDRVANPASLLVLSTCCSSGWPSIHWLSPDRSSDHLGIAVMVPILAILS